MFRAVAHISLLFFVAFDLSLCTGEVNVTMKLTPALRQALSCTVAEPDPAICLRQEVIATAPETVNGTQQREQAARLPTYGGNG